MRVYRKPPKGIQETAQRVYRKPPRGSGSYPQAMMVDIQETAQWYNQGYTGNRPVKNL